MSVITRRRRSIQKNNRDFIATWDTRNTSTGSSASNQIKLPLESDGDYDFDVYWGDGTYDRITAFDQPETTHTYAQEGEYTVVIKRKCKGFRFNNTQDRNKIKDIKSFGPLKLGNNGSYFYGCNNLTISADDPLDLSETTILDQAFRNCSSLTTAPSMRKWNTETITSMTETFFIASNFNENLNSWNVRNVTNLAYTFADAVNFNQDLNNWDTSLVRSFNRTFKAALNFNGNIENWNTSSATTMSHMFNSAFSFNRNISSWDVSNVTYIGYMFNEANSFNQDISNWNFSSLSGSTALDNFLFGADSFSTENYDKLLNRWSEQADLGQLVNNLSPTAASSFSDPEAVAARDNLIRNYGWTITNAPLEAGSALGVEFTTTGASEEVLIPLNGVTSIDIDWGDGTVDSGVTASNPTHTYAAAGSYIAKVSGTATGLGINGTEARWQSKVTSCLSFGDIGLTSLRYGFKNANANVGMPSFIPSSVTDLGSMFGAASSFNQDISSWNVTNVTSLYNMFGGAISFNQNIGGWNVGNVRDMRFLFVNTGAFDQDISSWDFGGLDGGSDLQDFMTNATGLSSTNYDALLVAWSNAVDAGTMFSQLGPNMGGSKFSDPEAVAARDNLIRNYNWTITNGPLEAGSALGVEFTTTGASEEVLIPLNGVTSVDIDWGDGTVDSGVTASNPTHTYAAAGSYIAKVSGAATGLGTLSDARWHSKLTSCLSFGDIGLTSLFNSFRSVSANVGMPSFIPSGVTSTQEMFRSASSFNQDISSWNVSSVTNMIAMFLDADAFDQDISVWDFSGLNSSNDLGNFMLLATGLSSTNYDALLVAWSEAADAGTIYSPLSPNMGGSKYSSLAAQLARENLISTHGWTIVQDGGIAAGAAAGPTLWLDSADELSITYTLDGAYIAENNEGLKLPGTSGNFALTINNATLDITSDIDIRLEVALENYDLLSDQILMGKGPANQNSSWYFYFQAGKLRLRINDVNGGGRFFTATQNIGEISGTRLWLRGTFAQNNGSNQSEVNFYKSFDNTTWTKIGISLTAANTLSMPSSNASLIVGGNSSQSNLPGSFYKAQIYDGIDGTLVYDADFTAQNYGTTSFLENANNFTVNITSTTNGLFSGSVSQWDDKSGNGYDVVQGTAADQPTTGVTTLNGLNVLDFDGNDDLERLTATSIGNAVTGATTYALVNFDALPSFSSVFAISTSLTFARFITQSNLSTAQVGGRVNDADSFDSTNSPVGTLSIGTFEVITGLYDIANTDLYLYVGSTLENSNASYQTNTTTSATNSVSIVIGKNNSYDSPITGQIAEILVFHGTHDSNTRSAVWSYLSSKWSVIL